MRHFLLLGNVLLLLAVLAPAGTLACSPAELDQLTTRLGTPDKAMQSEAMREIARFGQAPLPGLIERLGNGTPEQRRGSAIGLAMLPMPGFAADALLAALADEDTAVRSLAAYGLAVIGTTAAPGAGALLASPDEQVRNGAAYALMLMKDQAVPGLIPALDSDDPLVRAKAAWLLGRLGPDALPAVPALVRALDCDDERAMHVVAEAIDLIGPDPAMLALHFSLIGQTGNHPAARVGAQAATTLIRLLTRPGTLTGQIAFHALADMGRTAVPALLAALEYGTPGQRVAAGLLLVMYDPEFASELPEDVLEELTGAGVDKP